MEETIILNPTLAYEAHNHSKETGKQLFESMFESGYSVCKKIIRNNTKSHTENPDKCFGKYLEKIFLPFIALENNFPLDYSSNKITIERMTSDNNPFEGYDVCHLGYLKYLKEAYYTHLGVELAPWHFWTVIANQIAKIIKADTETYRKYFSTGKGMVIIEISDKSEEPYVAVLAKGILEKSPNPEFAQMLIPKFSYENPEFITTQLVAFCEISSPYFCGVIFGCGFPMMKILGTQQDWKTLLETMIMIEKTFPPESSLSQYAKQVISFLEDFDTNRRSEEWLKKFFYNGSCGSGSQPEYIGHYIKLLHNVESERIDVAMITASVEFRQNLNEHKKKLYSGLYASKVINGMLVPSYISFETIIISPKVTLPYTKEYAEAVFNEIMKISEILDSCSPNDNGLMYDVKDIIAKLDMDLFAKHKIGLFRSSFYDMVYTSKINDVIHTINGFKKIHKRKIAGKA